MVGTADMLCTRKRAIASSTPSGLNQRSSTARVPRMLPAFITVSPYECESGSTPSAHAVRSSSYRFAAARALPGAAVGGAGPEPAERVREAVGRPLPVHVRPLAPLEVQGDVLAEAPDVLLAEPGQVHGRYSTPW